MNDMKKTTLSFAFCAALMLAASAGNLRAQAVWIEPTPTDVTSLVRVYIDLLHPDCDCPLLADWAQSPPPSGEPDLFMWTWQPSDPAHAGGNGSWDNSNPNNMMRQDENNPAHWYKEMVPVAFYGVEPAEVYASGISFLIKRKNGSAIEGGEPKSADQFIPVEPVGCVEMICPFPTKFFQDEYMFFVYDNNQETNPGLRNLGPTDAHITFRYSVNGGPELVFPPAGTDPADFQMEYDGDGFFSYAFLPKTFFPIQEGDQITTIRAIITRLPLAVPPFRISDALATGCE
jgi:hypothetical protein